MLQERWLNTKDPGLTGFKYFRDLQKANDTKSKNWLLGRDQVQGTVKKT